MNRTFLTAAIAFIAGIAALTANDAAATGNPAASRPASDSVTAIMERDRPFFSFLYGGRPSSELLKTWSVERSSRTLDDNRVEHVLVYKDPKTGLEVRCSGIGYTAENTAEWTVYFTNRSSQDSPILESIKAVDYIFDAQPTWESFWGIRHFSGAQATYNDFEPKFSMLSILDPFVKNIVFKPTKGRSSSGVSPYFGIETASNKATKTSNRGGYIIAVGWP
jgi:alpha-galactosidase